MQSKPSECCTIPSVLLHKTSDSHNNLHKTLKQPVIHILQPIIEEKYLCNFKVRNNHFYDFLLEGSLEASKIMRAWKILNLT